MNNHLNLQILRKTQKKRNHLKGIKYYKNVFRLFPFSQENLLTIGITLEFITEVFSFRNVYRLLPFCTKYNQTQDRKKASMPKKVKGSFKFLN